MDTDNHSLDNCMEENWELQKEIERLKIKLQEYEQLCEGFKVVDLIRVTKKHSTFSLIMENLTEKLSVDYWKKRCLLAEIVVVSSPCDPDINKEQIEAHKNYAEFLQNNKQP